MPTRAVVLATVFASVAGAAYAADPIEATTAKGERVRLFENGRWEYVDPKKAEAQKPVVAAYEKERDEAKAKEQGGLFGFGRTIKPGDKDYNRGSLGGK